METIADFMARVLVERESPEAVGQDVVAFRLGYQTLYYGFDQGLPPRRRSERRARGGNAVKPVLWILRSLSSRNKAKAAPGASRLVRDMFAHVLRSPTLIRHLSVSCALIENSVSIS